MDTSISYDKLALLNAHAKKDSGSRRCHQDLIVITKTFTLLSLHLCHVWTMLQKFMAVACVPELAAWASRPDRIPAGTRPESEDEKAVKIRLTWLDRRLGLLMCGLGTTACCEQRIWRPPTWVVGPKSLKTGLGRWNKGPEEANRCEQRCEQGTTEKKRRREHQP